MRVTIRSFLVFLAAATALLPLTAAGESTQSAPNRPGGFWKCRVDSKVKGEFGGEDPIGLAVGQHIPTDCAIHWSDGHGKTYCFASLPSLNFFDSEPELLGKAQAFWQKEKDRERGAAR